MLNLLQVDLATRLDTAITHHNDEFVNQYTLTNGIETQCCVIAVVGYFSLLYLNTDRTFEGSTILFRLEGVGQLQARL